MTEDYTLLNRVLNNLETRRVRALEGKINSIPSPFKRFSEDFLGIEQGKMYVVSASTKVGKTQFSSYLFLYTPILYAYEHPEVLRLKIFYYPLEETPEDILERFMCFLLYKFDNIIIDRNDLKSSRNKSVPQEILDKFKEEKYKNILDFFNKTVVFSSISNPTGVWKELQKYAIDNGTVHTVKYKTTDDFGVPIENEKFDSYTPNDPEEYKLVIFDHFGLTTSENGLNLKQSMDRLGEYFIKLRNRYNFSVVLIQQQNTNSESLDAFKLNKNKASIQNLADSSYSSRNCDVCIGVNSPMRQDPDNPNWNGYDIKRLKDYFRYAEILLNRQGCAGGQIPLFFLGKSCFWAEMPKIDDKENLQRVYDFVESLNRKKNVSFFTFNKHSHKRFGKSKRKK